MSRTARPPRSGPRRPLLGPLRCAALGAALGASTLTACGDGPTEYRSAVLVTFDTTRADFLSPYGAPENLTPNLARLASESLVFDDASTVAPLTLPSHASMLTGLYPPRHGLRENGIAALPDSADTLAEAARAAGFQTGAFVAALVLDASFGLDQGFDVYAGPSREDGGKSSHTAELPADVVVDRALAWLRDRDPERPFFLWVHLFDPHGPYEPPERYRPIGTDDPRGMYMGEIGFADAQLGRLLDALRADGSLDETFVAFTADHGEAFGEHGEPTHGAYVYETTIRVPLLLRDPDGRAAGTRSDAVAGVTDLHPTLLDAMRLPRRVRVDGESLMPLLDGEPLPDERGVYFESYSGYLSYGWSHLAGWRDARGKYVHSSRPQLFETRTDPGETNDLLATDAELRERLRPYKRALADLGDAPTLALDDGAIDGDMLEDIRGLGYAGMAGDGSALPLPLAASDRPAPHENVRLYVACLQAQELSNQGDLTGAEELLQGVRAVQPDNPFMLDRLSTVLMRQARHAEALPLLERLLEVGPGWPGSYCNLGLALYETGQVDEGIRRTIRAIELDRDEPFFWDTLLRMLEESGRTDELAKWRAERPDGAANDG